MTIRLKHILLLAILLPVAALGFAWSGLMSVRASTGHWAATDWFLHWVMKNSVRTATLTVTPPSLENPALIPPAAGHYEIGCAICHGSPAQARSPAALAMLPPPPDLKRLVPEWNDAELFEIVKHGVRFTGMPAWPAQSRDDEVWSMVAFLRQLPSMDAEGYREAAGLAHAPPASGNVPSSALTCESCHADGKLDGNSIIPRLEGQSEPYLLESLRAYRDKSRPSGVMQQAVGSLAEEDLRELASFYASAVPAFRPIVATDPALTDAGQELAERGRPEDKVPACLSCHDHDKANPAYPRLSGQNRAYFELQLRLFQQGERGGTSFSHLMHNAAKNLKESDFRAVSAYFAIRPRQADK